jgi:uncharacterized membrane protein AbrB (regulator of aidB expression)
LIRNSFRALAVLAAGLLMAATWPPIALLLGGAVAAGAVWRFRARLRLATPYLAAGVLLSGTGLAFAMVAPDHDTTTVSNNPIRYCQPGQVRC